MAAAFRQHTSRALDPQLHTHVVIANRVKLAGRPVAGVRRPRDQARPAHPVGALPRRAASRADRPARRPLARARARDRRDRRRRRGGPGRVLPADRRWCTAGSTRSSTGSSTTMGREPTPRERWRLEREAVARQPPRQGPSLDAGGDLHAQWADQVQALGPRPGRGRRRRASAGRSHARSSDRSTLRPGRRPGAGRARRSGSRRGGRPSWSASSPPRSPPTHRPRRRQARRLGRAARRRVGGGALCRHVPAGPARCPAAPRRPPGHRVGPRPGPDHPGDPRPGSRPARLGRPPPRPPAATDNRPPPIAARSS